MEARGGVPDASSRAVDLGCAVVLCLAVLVPGLVAALDLPGRIELVADLAGAALLVGIVVVIVQRRLPVVVPYLALVGVGLLIAGLLGADELLRALVSTKNFALLPALALALALLGPDEARTRLVVLTVIALVGFQFPVSIVQSLTIEDVDLIVGTFGDYSGPSVAFAALTGACLALGAYAAGHGRAGAGSLWWLAFAVIVPLLSIWAAIRVVPLVFPLAALAVLVAAWRGARGEPAAGAKKSRRPFVLLAAVAAGTVALIGGYAIERPSDLGLLTSWAKTKDYFETGDITEPASSGGVQIGRSEQYRIAIEMIDDEPLIFVFGSGLGTTTYAENLGVERPASPDLVSVGFSDFGTMLVELGWLTIVVSGLALLALAIGAIARVHEATPGSWGRALLVAYPGIALAICFGIFHGAPLRNIGSATIFWLLTGLVGAYLLAAGRRGLTLRKQQHPGS